MAVFAEVAELIPALRGRLEADVCAADLPVAFSTMTDAEILAILEEAAELAGQVEQIKLAAIGVATVRSDRSRGHSGLAQSQGRRSAADLVQKATGCSKGEASREVRVGKELVEAACGSGSDGGGEDAGGPEPVDEEDETPAQPEPPAPWFGPLLAALHAGVITTAQYDVIRGGLGEPPEADDDDDLVRETWRCAAEQLVAEAGERTLEELRAAARTMRDLLDPTGAEERFQQQFEARSFRVYRDSSGQKRGSIVFDEENGAFVESVLSAALRPRRGGPRFMDAEERARAEELVADPRTNDQLAYDLLIDVLRAGVLAEPAAVFGTRQAGLRLVRVVGSPVVHTEDGLVSFPASVAEQHVCNSGSRSVTVDSRGNPLDVAREHRLFTPAQRVALAIRDGGCRWQGCDRPASYCEAHHIDEWSGGGRTDIDRGILLCRFHHMNLHHGGCRITRVGKGDFVLHHPDGRSTVLTPRAVLKYAWSPPPPRKVA